MKLVKIKNSYMFKSDNPNGFHDYLVFYNRETRSYFAVQLTHLYVRDKKRFVQVQKGNILIQKFKEYETPSGVKKEIYKNDVNGKKLVLKNNSEIKKIYRRISRKQEINVKNFIFNKKKT